jgi:hypothetical protein
MSALHAETDHLEMMRRPERWPQVFILPLQHKTRREPDGSMRLLGFMTLDVLTGQAVPKVYVGLIYYRSMGLKLEDMPVEEYADLDAVVAAGWEVN